MAASVLSIVEAATGRTCAVQLPSPLGPHLFSTIARDAATLLGVAADAPVSGSCERVKITYRDEDGDLISVDCEEEARAALEYGRACGGVVLYAALTSTRGPSLTSPPAAPLNAPFGAPQPDGSVDMAALHEAVGHLASASEALLRVAAGADAESRAAWAARAAELRRLLPAPPAALASPAPEAAPAAEEPRTAPAGPILTPAVEMSPFTPALVPPSPSGSIHTGIRCDMCSAWPIRGTRFKCSGCENFDLCEGCEASGRHDPRHVMLKIRHPRRVHVLHASSCPPPGPLLLPRAMTRAPSATSLHAGFPSPGPAPSPPPVPLLLPAPPQPPSPRLGGSFVDVPPAPLEGSLSSLSPSSPRAGQDPSASFSSALLAMSDPGVPPPPAPAQPAEPAPPPPEEPASPPPAEPPAPASLPASRILSPEEFEGLLDGHGWTLVESRRELEALLSSAAAS